MANEIKAIRDRIRELRRVKASELIPNPRNWRRHPKAQQAAVRGVLEEIGYADALLARETAAGLMLIDGHLRRDVTPSQTVPVLVLDVSQEEADKILLTLDPLAALAEVDKESLRSLMDSVKFSSDELAEALRPMWPGRSDIPADLQDPASQIDKAAEFRKKWRTERGQLWQIGGHRLVCADSRGVEIGLLMGSEAKVRMIWTDPPYGVSYASKNEFLNRGDRGNRVQTPIANDSLTPEEIQQLFAGALINAVPFCTPGAAIYATVPAGPLYTRFIAGLEEAGFTFKHGLVWVKNQFVIGMSDYHYRHEPVIYGWLENGAHLWAGDRSCDSVFEVNKPTSSDMHPTTKPVELIAQMVVNSSNPGEIVFDPFCGSGSTLVAAEQLGRKGYGIEFDPGYVAVALERLSMIGLKPEMVG